MSPSAPTDPEGAAARVLGEMQGGPDEGPPSSPKSTEAQRKRWREKARARYKAKRPKVTEAPPEPYTPDPGRVAACALLSRTAWGIAGRMFGYRDLTEEEATQLGAAVDPVMEKYLPVFAEWQAEINLAVTIFALAQATKLREVPVEGEAPAVGVSVPAGAGPTDAG